MLTASTFVYGRTRTLDYRWLAKPELALKTSFFADVLERQRIALGNGSVDYFVCSSENLCLVSAFFVDASLLDQRGRQIAFAAGFTSDPRFCRDFAYFLPDTLLNFGRWLEELSPRLASIVASDGQIDLHGFDIHAESTSVEVDRLKKNYSRSINRSIIQESYGAHPLEPSLESRAGTMSQASLKWSKWLAEQAKILRRKPSTPEVICSFDYCGLGNVVDSIDSRKGSIERGLDSWPSSQINNSPAVSLSQGKSKADEIRDFVKGAEASPGNELIKQKNVAGVSPISRGAESSRREDAPSFRKNRDIRSIFDKLRRK